MNEPSSIGQSIIQSINGWMYARISKPLFDQILTLKLKLVGCVSGIFGKLAKM